MLFDGTVLRARFAGLESSKLRCGDACPPAFSISARLALVSFLGTGVACAVMADEVFVEVVVEVAEVAFARDVARVLVTVTVC